MDTSSAVEIPTVKATEKIMGGAAVGVRTCTKDLFVLYDAFVTAANDQSTTRKTSTSNSPLKQVNYLISTTISMNGPTPNEALCGLGWARVQLLETISATGANPLLIPDVMLIVGDDVLS